MTLVISGAVWLLAGSIITLFGLSDQAAVYCLAHLRTVALVNIILSLYVPLFGVFQGANHSGIPTIVVINKIDLTTPAALEALVEQWQAKIPEAIIIPCSAKEQIGMTGVLNAILERLPEGEAFYPKDTLTDKTLRFFASEIIREKILLNYEKEIPYCCEIEIDTYKEEPTIDRISATIYVSRQSQKGIVIGHKGERLKRVGQQAREDMERFLQKKVFLQLFVKVQEDWRNNERQLRRFGYDQQ
jgi:GTP-binding protein Era